MVDDLMDNRKKNLDAEIIPLPWPSFTTLSCHCRRSSNQSALMFSLHQLQLTRFGKCWSRAFFCPSKAMLMWYFSELGFAEMKIKRLTSKVRVYFLLFCSTTAMHCVTCWKAKTWRSQSSAPHADMECSN